MAPEDDADTTPAEPPASARAPTSASTPASAPSPEAAPPEETPSPKQRAARDFWAGLDAKFLLSVVVPLVGALQVASQLITQRGSQATAQQQQEHQQRLDLFGEMLKIQSFPDPKQRAIARRDVLKLIELSAGSDARLSEFAAVERDKVDQEVTALLAQQKVEAEAALQLAQVPVPAASGTPVSSATPAPSASPGYAVALARRATAGVVMNTSPPAAPAPTAPVPRAACRNIAVTSPGANLLAPTSVTQAQQTCAQLDPRSSRTWSALHDGRYVTCTCLDAGEP